MLLRGKRWIFQADARTTRSAFWQRRKKKLAPSGDSSSDALVLRLSDANVRSLAPCCVEVAPLLGRCAEMRPVLECVFHRMLACSRHQTRMAMLTEIREVSFNV